jgi:hypothetical protein
MLLLQKAVALSMSFLLVLTTLLVDAGAATVPRIFLQAPHETRWPRLSAMLCERIGRCGSSDQQPTSNLPQTAVKAKLNASRKQNLRGSSLHSENSLSTLSRDVYSVPDESLLSRVSPTQEVLHTAFEIDAKTNDRLLAEIALLPGIGPHELVFGVPYASIINAAFTHAHPNGSRFNRPDRAAWYAPKVSGRLSRGCLPRNAGAG